jgi:hypothetical protein
VSENSSKLTWWGVLAISLVLGGSVFALVSLVNFSLVGIWYAFVSVVLGLICFEIADLKKEKLAKSQSI